MKITVEVVDLWDAPDAVRQYLETGDETLRAAARGDTRVHRLKEMINEQ